MTYRGGSFETQKFAGRKRAYYEGLAQILSLGYDQEDLIHHFPSFVGHMTLARVIALYELYKMTLGIPGHIAEAGVYKGGASLLFAKLTRIFEPESLTLVHGFDWFKGAVPTDEEPNILPGSYQESYPRLIKLIEAQGLDNIVHIHELDLATELGGFFEQHPYIQFKLVFLDAGLHDVVRSCIEHFWPRLTSGGVIVFDQFNHELAPGETRALKELMPDARLQTFPWAWMPTAYVVKP